MYLDTHGHDGDEATEGADHVRAVYRPGAPGSRPGPGRGQDAQLPSRRHRAPPARPYSGARGDSARGTGIAGDQPGDGPPAGRAEITGQGQGQEPSAGYTQYTLRAKKALDLARREALQLGHHHIGTEHILLSLIREGEGPAAQALLELGADLSLVRQQVLLLLSEEPGPRSRGPSPSAPRPGPAGGGEGRLLAEILSRIEDLDSRLSAVEQRLGTGPDVRDLDQQIAQARRDKESAVSAEDYETRGGAARRRAAAARRQGLPAEGVGQRRTWTFRPWRTSCTG